MKSAALQTADAHGMCRYNQAAPWVSVASESPHALAAASATDTGSDGGAFFGGRPRRFPVFGASLGLRAPLGCFAGAASIPSPNPLPLRVAFSGPPLVDPTNISAPAIASRSAYFR